MADANLTALAYIEESVWGTTPSSALALLRYTGESLTDQKTATESAEIIATRDLRDVLQTARSTSGDISFELAFGAHDDLFEGALGSDWVSDVLVNGATKKSYTFEKHFSDLSNEFAAAKGCRIDTLNLNFSLGAIATGSIGVVGLRTVHGAATAGSGSYTAAPTAAPISTIDFAVEEASSPLSGVTELTLAISNNLRAQSQLGDADLFGVGVGGFRLTGTINVYFASRALITKYDNHTESDVEITVDDEDGNQYVFTIPAIRYTSAAVLAEGVNSDVMAQLGFTAIIDSVSGNMFQITRNAA